MVKAYKIMRGCVEYDFNDRYRMIPGCTLQDSGQLLTIRLYPDKKQAIKTLENGYDTSIEPIEPPCGQEYYTYEEYFVAEVEYDKDGEEYFIGYIAVTKPNFFLSHKEEWETIGSFDTYKEAEEFLAEFEQQNEAVKGEYLVAFGTNGITLL